MPIQHLIPKIDFLTEEFVLIQAWKKTVSHIRRHNWYADTMEMDREAVNLPKFIERLQSRFQDFENWTNRPLRIVPAPKSQNWEIDTSKKRWSPTTPGEVKLRPLAHVTIEDQVAATAIMMCLADRVETIQGNSGGTTRTLEERKRVISYGNRLVAEEKKNKLWHNWGSGKLYRQYFQDYRAFLERPESNIDQFNLQEGMRLAVVHSDLKQFYDRVTPELLNSKLRALKAEEDDDKFFDLVGKIFNWTWDHRDAGEVGIYSQQAGLADFSRVPLPQGLVASGFFANVVLLDFDNSIRETFETEIINGIVVKDACRYVDDLRFVVTVSNSFSPEDVENQICQWIRDSLDKTAPGLEPSADKTRVAFLDGEERPLVRQSKKMSRIQTAMSGGFDAVAGEEILDSLLGLLRTQQRYSTNRASAKNWSLAPVADVRDETVARFTAARFRSTYRALRPLLPADKIELQTHKSEVEEPYTAIARIRSQKELDEDVRAFSLGLIEKWISDPSNVRLLRIGLDLWPDDIVLESVLGFLRPYTEKGGTRGPARRVAWYCLAEIFRAGATETGFVGDTESFPDGVNLERYREILSQEALRIASMSGNSLPWYLNQQALLFLTANAPNLLRISHSGSSTERKHYYGQLLFLQKQMHNVLPEEYATRAIIARRSYFDKEQALHLCKESLTPARLEEIGARDPSFCIELLRVRPDLDLKISPRLRDDLCVRRDEDSGEWISLAELVSKKQFLPKNEPTVLDIALKALSCWPENVHSGVVSPYELLLKMTPESDEKATVVDVRFAARRVMQSGSIYSPPSWCPDEHKWKFQLGYLIRFILSSQEDFTNYVIGASWREHEPIYRVPQNHWYQRRYGFYNGQRGFGNDWIGITDWLESFLSALLRWPGCRSQKEFAWVEKGIDEAKKQIGIRLDKLNKMRSPNGLWLLPMTVTDPKIKKGKPDSDSAQTRPLRACIVQTAIPTPSDLFKDQKMEEIHNRKKHKNHLATALAAVERMLDLRETHRVRDGRLDWLILPELSVHPEDVRRFLVPFARAHKAIVLAGLTYQELFSGQPLVNSAIWVIPTHSADGKLQIITRRQGKFHLSKMEEQMNETTKVLQPFRPCQWLVGYNWSKEKKHRPLWLTASICYDSTDLELATALRNHSDVFAIPALNQDVGTFDQMALALHYHMYQLVMVVNNGIFGGSNAYMPVKESFKKQIFHLHGQPQASIAFLEIDDIQAYLKRHKDGAELEEKETESKRKESKPFDWKYPPAGNSKR
ncbi:MAG: hypothetical protein JXX29_18410 [Deltaproteobacteria bacterium]|nr:hypothetical protein [Deltaproteobacteria bacterium]MBN2673659.1 hypothetical protein [Deltaproteobacteria bacterium]